MKRMAALLLQVIVSCGYWDNSIRCYSSEEGRLLQSIRQHKDIVTCIEAGSDGCTLATGDSPLTILLPLPSPFFTPPPPCTPDNPQSAAFRILAKVAGLS